MTEYYQTVTLKLADGREVSYTGRAQIIADAANPPRVVDIMVSEPKPLPAGVAWDVMTSLMRDDER